MTLKGEEIKAMLVGKTKELRKKGDKGKEESLRGKEERNRNKVKGRDESKKIGCERGEKERSEERKQGGSSNVIISYYVQFRHYARVVRRTNTL